MLDDMMTTTLCENCDEAFEPRSGNQRFCSSGCRAVARQARLEADLDRLTDAYWEAEDAEAAAKIEAAAKRVRKMLRAVDCAAEIGIRTGACGPL